MFDRKPKIKMMLGLRNIVTNGKQWKYLLFYEIDNPSEGDIKLLHDLLEDMPISYIVYSTKAGLHVIGLSHMEDLERSYRFDYLQMHIPEYYSGQTIRISRKKGENQELLFYNLDHELMLNLLHIYARRFPELQKYKYYPDWINLGMPKVWHLVPEKYWSYKK